MEWLQMFDHKELQVILPFWLRRIWRVFVIEFCENMYYIYEFCSLIRLKLPTHFLLFVLIFFIIIL